MNQAQTFHGLKNHRAVLFAIFAVLSLLLTVEPVFAQVDFERAPISYSKTQDENQVTRLIKRLQKPDSSESLEWEAEHGYLKSLLRLLKISPSTQTLVFSKTSLQQHRISPATPRAIYFNDDVYVGWVPNGDVIEISVADPQLGGVFYTLSQKDVKWPTLKREDFKCLQCHGSTHTRRVPGHIVRSVYTGTDGLPIFRAGTHRTLDSSPFSERFGGWYVTGKSGGQHHMGNQTIDDPDRALELNRSAGSNRERLDDLFDVDAYLTQHSDIVALMVLVHQVTVHNAITAANHSARIALHDAVVMNKALERPEDYVSDSTTRRLTSAADKVVDAVLMANSQPFTHPISGSSDFAREFGRSGSSAADNMLRELNLQNRLFRYPCSFLVHSEAFESLPKPVLGIVREKMKSLLSAEELSEKRFVHLDAQARRDVLRLLSDQQFFSLDE